MKKNELKGVNIDVVDNNQFNITVKNNWNFNIQLLYAGMPNEGRNYISKIVGISKLEMEEKIDFLLKNTTINNYKSGNFNLNIKSGNNYTLKDFELSLSIAAYVIEFATMEDPEQKNGGNVRKYDKNSKILDLNDKFVTPSFFINSLYLDKTTLQKAKGFSNMEILKQYDTLNFMKDLTTSEWNVFFYALLMKKEGIKEISHNPTEMIKLFDLPTDGRYYTQINKAQKSLLTQNIVLVRKVEHKNKTTSLELSVLRLLAPVLSSDGSETRYSINSDILSFFTESLAENKMIPMIGYSLKELAKMKPKKRNYVLIITYLAHTSPYAAPRDYNEIIKGVQGFNKEINNIHSEIEKSEEKALKIKENRYINTEKKIIINILKELKEKKKFYIKYDNTKFKISKHKKIEKKKKKA